MSQPVGAPCEPLKPGTVFAGRYEILGQLGAGGYSKIYRVREQNTATLRALKVLVHDLEGEAIQVARFHKEAELTARLQHPHVRRVMNSGVTDEGAHFMAMEYLEGRSLEEIIGHTSFIFSIPRIVRWGLQLADALQAIHAQGIIHRDVKPDNVFLAGEESSAQVKLIDFGIAWSSDGSETYLWNNPGIVWGTPAYMAPEQATGRPPDPRSDLYSLGAVLYEMLTGRVPHQGVNLFDIWGRARAGKLRTTREVRLDVPPLLEAIVHWLLAPNPENRPQSAAALQYHLSRVLQPNYF